MLAVMMLIVRVSIIYWVVAKDRIAHVVAVSELLIKKIQRISFSVSPKDVGLLWFKRYPRMAVPRFFCDK